MNSRSWWVIAVIAVLMGVLGFLLFEIREVPDVQWQETYGYESKQPYGTWVFNALLEARFNDVSVFKHGEDTLLVDIESVENLYILMGVDIVLEDEERDDLLDFVAEGNDVLFLAESVELGYNDEINYYVIDSRTDSMVEVNYFWDSLQQYSFTFYDIDFARAGTKDFYSCVADTFAGYDLQTLGTMQDSLPIFTKIDFGLGSLYCHSVPYLFSNMASKQPLFLEHFNRVFQGFSPNMVIVDHMRYHIQGNLAQSQLQFVLSQKPLRTAYYLLLVTLVVFIIFRSKRKQRAIPVVETKRNTTLEHIHTLAHLYLHQDQHKKLVRHLEEIFNHKMYTRYFLKRSQGDFVDQLVKKSTVEVEEVQQIVDDFERARNRPYMQASSLRSLFERLEIFYGKCK